MQILYVKTCTSNYIFLLIVGIVYLNFKCKCYFSCDGLTLVMTVNQLIQKTGQPTVQFKKALNAYFLIYTV